MKSIYVLFHHQIFHSFHSESRCLIDQIRKHSSRDREKISCFLVSKEPVPHGCCSTFSCLRDHTHFADRFPTFDISDGIQMRTIRPSQNGHILIQFSLQTKHSGKQRSGCCKSVPVSSLVYRCNELRRDEVYHRVNQLESNGKLMTSLQFIKEPAGSERISIKDFS